MPQLRHKTECPRHALRDSIFGGKKFHSSETKGKVVERVQSRFAPLIKIGSEAQPLMAQIRRWNRWHEIGAPRVQNVLEHAHSIQILAAIVLTQLAPYGALIDPQLVSLAITVHDMPEGLLKRDVPQPFKTADDDVREYLVFAQQIADLPVRSRERFERAFLLQFAVRPNEWIEKLPIHAQKVVREIKAHWLREAEVFAALEELDYILYAIEHMEREKILFHQVISIRVPVLNGLSDNIAGFREEIWPRWVSDTLLKKAAEM
ncbi:MAG: hypothetical protein WA021_00530 [Minisyncoccia bacterium]